MGVPVKLPDTLSGNLRIRDIRAPRQKSRGREGAGGGDLGSPARARLTENLVVTCSGNFSGPAFLCTVMALGVDNVLFSVDWPYESNVAAVEFLKRQPLDPHQMEKVAHGNAERILRL